MSTSRKTVCVPADLDAITRAAELLRNGGLVAFPTETVYGLGANALDATAVTRIFAAKGRPANNPIIVHVADASLVRIVAADWPETAAYLAEKFWPGPLTLVLPKRDEVPIEVTAGGPTVAVRVPAHPVAQALLREAGIPVAAPSANRSSELSPTTAQHVLKSLDGLVDMILDGGTCPGGIESTVVDVTTLPPRLLRPGLVTVAQLEEVIGELIVDAKPQAALRSPGLLERHYAPRTPLELAADDGAACVRELSATGMRIGWLTWVDAPKVGGVERRGLPGDPAGYASGLYAALHELDAMGLDSIIVAAVPSTADWLAIRDRLIRGSRRC
jgi:L-threonylcarbamoyladenylate synthase